MGSPRRLAIPLAIACAAAAVAAAENSPLQLPMPRDERALALAHRLLGQAMNDNGEGVDELAQQYGMARRTLERRFHDETGMSFGMWRQKARLLGAVQHCLGCGVARNQYALPVFDSARVDELSPTFRQVRSCRSHG